MSGPPLLRARINATNVPIGLAFDVFFKFDGREQRVGEASFVPQKDPWCTQIDLSGVIPASATADVILRPSLDVASRSMGVTSFWNREVVFKDVPIEDMENLRAGSAGTQHK